MAKKEELKYYVDLELKKFEEKLKKLQGEISGLGTDAPKDTEKAGKGFSNLAGKIAGATAAIVALRKTYNLLKENLAEGIETQTNMAEVYTLMNRSTQEFEHLTREVINLSTEVPEKASGLASALYEVVSAGIEVGESIQFLEIAAKAGVAGITQTKVAVDALTSIMNAYGLAADQAENVSDTLFTTVRLGKTRFEQMASTLGMIIPVASAYNVAFEQIAASYATLTKNGVKAEQTSTSLAAAITEIVDPGSKASKAIRGLGYESGEAALKQKTLQEISAELYDSGYNLAEIFGREASRAILILGKNSKTASEDLQAMANSAGATEQAYKKMGDTLKVQREILHNNLRALGDLLNRTIIPYLVKASQAATNFIRSLTETPLDKTIRELKSLGVATENLQKLKEIQLTYELEKANQELRRSKSEYKSVEAIQARQNELIEKQKSLLLERAEIEGRGSLEKAKELDSIQQRNDALKLGNTLSGYNADTAEGEKHARQAMLRTDKAIADVRSGQIGKDVKRYEQIEKELKAIEKEKEEIAKQSNLVGNVMALEGQINALKKDTKTTDDDITDEKEKQAAFSEAEARAAEEIKKILFDRLPIQEKIAQVEKEISALKSLDRELTNQETLELLKKEDLLKTLQEDYKRILAIQNALTDKQKDLLSTSRYFADTFAEAAFNAKNMGDILVDSASRFAQQIASDAFYYLLWLAVTGGQGAFTGGSSGFNLLAGMIKNRGVNLPGYAEGGSFTVPGSGGTDSQTVMFKATPGERVDVSTPGNDGMSRKLDEIIQLLKKGGQFKANGYDLELVLDARKNTKL